jgi:hypothetical protein
MSGICRLSIIIKGLKMGIPFTCIEDYVASFWAKVNKKGPFPQKVKSKKEWQKTVKKYPELEGTRCWDWIASVTGSGHGQFGWIDGMCLAHRLAYFLKFGKWPIKLLCHKCDNPACVRLLHLFEDTKYGNIQDRQDKGRQSKGKKHGIAIKRTHPNYQGEKHPRALFKDTDVIHIRKIFKLGLMSVPDLAISYKVSRAVIYHIVNRRRYIHI